jgi:hypothetical protein
LFLRYTHVSNNNNLSRIAGGAVDAALTQLRNALHCSFGMGNNGCVLFFIQAGAGAITLLVSAIIIKIIVESMK